MVGIEILTWKGYRSSNKEPIITHKILKKKKKKKTSVKNGNKNLFLKFFF